MMLDSGARGSKDQLLFISWYAWYDGATNGEVMETTVKTNFFHKHNVFEYFISTHGARKGQSDIINKTANSGYLTRRLVDGAP